MSIQVTMIHAEGLADVENVSKRIAAGFGLLAWDMSEHADPNDGVVTTVTALTTIVAGTLTGQTGVSSPVLASIVQIDASNTLGDAESLYQFSVVEVADSLEDAESAAHDIAGAASDVMESNSSGGSGESGIGTPPGGPVTDPPGEEPDDPDLDRDAAPRCLLQVINCTLPLDMVPVEREIFSLY